MSDTLCVLAAPYDHVDDALADCEAIKVAHDHVGRDLMTLGEVLDEGDAGVVVVYSADMADRVGTGFTRARRTARATTTLSAAQLAAEMR